MCGCECGVLVSGKQEGKEGAMYPDITQRNFEGRFLGLVAFGFVQSHDKACLLHFSLQRYEL